MATTAIIRKMEGGGGGGGSPFLDHNAAEVSMLERTEGRVLLREDVREFNVEGV